MLRTLLESMPKVELHLHLEGAIPPDTMWELVVRHGGDPEIPDPAALARRQAFRDFAHFIDTWTWKLRFHTTYEDYTFMAEAVARELVRRAVVRAEVFVSPTDVAHHGLEPGPLLLAVRRGLDRVPGVEVALVPDLVRDTGPARADRTLDRVLEVASEAGVVGVTIGGSEQRFPPGPFAQVFARARRAGLRTSAHAGEAAGPSSVMAAIRELGVDRIGHGIRAVEDPAVLAEVVGRRIPLEVCPTSNLRTGVVAGWSEHPLPRLIEAGAVVTINSDDPALFGVDLVDEYESLANRFGYGRDTILAVAAAAIDASWTDETGRRSLHARLRRWRDEVGW